VNLKTNKELQIFHYYNKKNEKKFNYVIFTVKKVFFLDPVCLLESSFLLQSELFFDVW
jgi:hypothetical protein